MSRETSYLQFPLCALAFGKTEGERLNAILDYSIVNAGTKLWQKLPAQQQDAISYRMRKRQDLPAGFEINDWLHCAAFYGAEILGVRCTQVAGLLQGFQSLRDFVSAFEARHGRDPWVRLRKDLFFKVRGQRGLTYREFAVFCAIVSCIGDKVATQITEPRIQRCALGYRRTSIMAAEVGRRADGTQPLTAQMLLETIDRLHRNRLITHRTYPRRVTYYSTRLDEELLYKVILNDETYESRSREVALEKALTEAVQLSRAEAIKTVTQIPAA